MRLKVKKKRIKMSGPERLIKAVLDIVVAFFALLLFSLFIILLIILSTLDTKQFGLFSQKRVGYKSKLFSMYKIRTMKQVSNVHTTVTTLNDVRITRFGRFLRRYKLDELPQLINVLLGQMSFVGPRPDVVGFADALKGDYAIILTIKPGITGPATLYFRNEERLLAEQENPEDYNRDVIWPKKVALNKQYIQNYSLLNDFKYIFYTIFVGYKPIK